MAYIRAYLKSNLQAVEELLPAVKKDCGDCFPSALTFGESLQRFPQLRHSKNFVVSLLACDHLRSFHPELLLDVWVLNSIREIKRSGLRDATVFHNDGNEDEPNPLTIYLSRDLKNDYKFLSASLESAEKCIVLRRVTPIPVKRITIGALSVESYEWAKNHLRDFLMKCVDCRLVIVKQSGILGEVFAGSDQHEMLSRLIVLESLPITQGVLTPDTMLIICDIHHVHLGKWQLKRLKSMQGHPRALSLPLLKIPGKKFLVNVNQVINMDEPDGGIFGLGKKEMLDGLQVSLLDSPLHSTIPHDVDQSADVDSQIWITNATRAHLGWNVGTWVRVSACPADKDVSTLRRSSSDSVPVRKISSGQRPKSSKIKLAQVFVIDEHCVMECIWQNHGAVTANGNQEFINGIAYISPILLFNLLPSPVDDIKSITLLMERAELRESPPCLAKEINISMITSPVTKITNMYDEILTQHFSTPRLVSKEDVLCVYCDWKNLNTPNTPAVVEEGLPRSHLIYFKVNKVNGSEDSLSYFVDAKQSKLFQSDSDQSYVPAMAESFLQNCVKVKEGKAPYWLSAHPKGLDVCVTRLEIVLRSLLLNHQTTAVFPILLSGPPGVGKKTSVRAVSRLLNLHIVEVNCYEICGDTTAATEARLRNCCHKAFACAPCILLFANVHCLGKDKDASEKEPRIVSTLMLNLEEVQRATTHPVIILGTTSDLQSMTSELHSCFLDEIEIESPTESEREDMMVALSSGFLIGPGVSFKVLASRTAGMVLADFCALFAESVIQAQEDVMTYCRGIGLVPAKTQHSDKHSECIAGDMIEYNKKLVRLQEDICSAGILLQSSHFDKALQVLQSAHSDSIGAPKIPNVSWQDIGGLGDVKQEILDTIQLPFQYPELFAAGLQRSGILLYGPPGTGKTLVAKAVATECSLNFLSVKGPELINMYVGQSEENVREVFATASRAAPCVIFFDELDSLAPNRGRSGDSGGVMDRVVSQLLAELDGLQKSRDVFVIGATNRPDLLDPALLRPGRFDILLYLGINKEKEDRMNIMKALTRKFQLSEELDLEQLIDKCPPNLTGADFYALCSNALLNSIRRRIQSQETGSGNAEIVQEDFELAIENLVPSVSNEELARYEKIRLEFTKNKKAEKEPEEDALGELELDGKLGKETDV